MDRHKTPDKWLIEKETLHAQCKIFDVYKRQCKHPETKKQGDFFLIKTGDWVQAIGLTADNELILIQQYRFGVDSLSWEIPGGVIDQGESPIDAAIRELKEETGYVGTSATLLAHHWPNPAILNNTVYFVVIENCTDHQNVNWDINEEIKIKTTPLSNLDQMIDEGFFHHAITINSLFYLKKHLEKITNAKNSNNG